MSTDPTEQQGGRELRQSRDMSLKRGHPPTQVPGYEPEKFLGVGAYGEVWVARERNTGRRVAIKFYAHRGGLDWSLLSREVEKLAFLFADRYVVQLLGVGWDSEPPYYIMEYLERGSLAEHLEQGPLSVNEAVDIFRDVATGLLHAHGKGVLHCDLKPANILLDEDNKPRLADFGQSRLSSEQTPALGTLFYMAPEQADLEAAPDARWDVYALGAILYCMLTGGPPHRSGQAAKEFEHTPNLLRRLNRYRRLIEQAPTPSGHRHVRGVDSELAAIVERCLAADPDKRFPNIQAVLEALEHRDRRRAQRPLMVLGTIGPALLLLVVSWFAWHGFRAAVDQSNTALTRQVLSSNEFAAQYVARATANELEKRFRAVEEMADSDRFRQAVSKAFSQPDFRALLDKLSNPDATAAELKPLRREFQQNSIRKNLQNEFNALIPEKMKPSDRSTASWFFCDPRGISTLRDPESKTIGDDFAYRSYFHGGPKDYRPTWRPGPEDHVKKTQLSAVFRSNATKRWIVAVCAPVVDQSPERKFLGVVALTVELGQFAELKGRNNQFAVLVDRREGDNKGVILQHPLFDKLVAKEGNKEGKLPDRFEKSRVRSDQLPDTPEHQQNYHDPLADDPEGGVYQRRWLARMEPVSVRGKDTGWIVIIQEAYDTAIGATLKTLTKELVRYGLFALILVTVVMGLLWGFVAKLSKNTGKE